MSIDLRDCEHFTITDLSGGLNQFASSFKVKDNEVIATSNMSYNDSGGVRSRRGRKAYDTLAIDIVDPITDQFRYITSDGTKRCFATAGNKVYMDADDGVYAALSDPLTTDDNHVRYVQWWDTLFATTKSPAFGGGMRVYNENESTTSLTGISLFAYNSNVWDLFTISGGIAGGTLKGDGYYHYRWTIEYKYGDYMGESSPQYVTSDGKILYTTREMDTSSSSANTWVATFSRKAEYNLGAVGVSRINMYRSSFRATSEGQPDGYPSDKTEYFHIGSIDVDDYNSTAQYDTVFQDAGIVGGYTIEYNKMDLGPEPRFLVNHKNRLWAGNVVYYEGRVEGWSNGTYGSTDTVSAPHRIFISSINNAGESAPLEYYTDQNVDVEPFGEGITGMVSFNNDVLVVFKANSMWGVYGDDPVANNISVRQLSDSVGCIAPESITKAEGNLVWLSNSGVFHWNGASRPSPLKGDNIDTSIKEIPDGAKSRACSVYDPKRREILIAHAGPDTGGYNRIVEHFYLRTGSWGQDNPTESGYSSFLAKQEPDEETVIIAGVGDTAVVMTAASSAYQLNSHNFDVGGNASGILAEFQTKHYDHGSPFMDKNFVAIQIEGKFHKEFTEGLHVVCDNRIDTRIDDAGGFDIPPTNSGNNYLTWYSSPATPTEEWYEDPDSPSVWAAGGSGFSEISLDDRIWGKRISLVFSVRTLEEIGIDSITVFYKPRTGSRR